MDALGYNVWLHKYIAFVLSAAFAGFAGVLFVYYKGFISPEAASIIVSAEVMLMVILGGAGTLSRACGRRFHHHSFEQLRERLHGAMDADPRPALRVRGAGRAHGHGRCAARGMAAPARRPRDDVAPASRTW